MGFGARGTTRTFVNNHAVVQGAEEDTAIVTLRLLNMMDRNVSGIPNGCCLVMGIEFVKKVCLLTHRHRKVAM